jgi:hypothetical protein
MAEENKGMGVNVGVPDIGDLVMYEGKRWRVSSWLRERVPKKLNLDEIPGEFPWEEILYEAQQEVHGKKLRFCYREDAQFLGLAGVGGDIAPVDECRVVGKVGWSEAQIDSARKGALLLAEKGEVVF